MTVRDYRVAVKSAKIVIEIPPEWHDRMQAAARARGLSYSAWVEQTFRGALLAAAMTPAAHLHLCLNCGAVIERGVFDCGQDGDHAFALCDLCVVKGVDVGETPAELIECPRCGRTPDRCACGM